MLSRRILLVLTLLAAQASASWLNPGGEDKVAAIRASYVGDDEDETKEWIGDVEYPTIRDFAGKVLSKSDPFVQFLLEPMDFPNEKERLKTARFLLGFPVSGFLRSGAIGLGHSAPKGDDDLDGFVILNKFDPQAKKGMFASFTSFWASGYDYYKQSKNVGTPELFTKSSNRGLMSQFLKVAGNADKNTKAWHTELGPKEPHLKVCQIAGNSIEIVQKMMTRIVDVAGNEESIFIGTANDDEVKMLQEALSFQIVGKKDVEDPTDKTRKLPLTFLLRSPPGKET